MSFFLASRGLVINHSFNILLTWTLTIWSVWILAKVGGKIIDFLFYLKIKKQEGNTAEALKTLSLIAKVSLWLFLILLALSNMGFNVNAVFAGLGIGGIAVALAVQNILSDLFSSFAIYFDKPFEVGDFIVFGDKLGVVEKIGIKTTRIKALQGEEIVISNKELTSGQIQNFKKLQERRITFSFGVKYGTTNVKLKKIKKIMADVISKIDNCRFDRCHFYRFDDFSLFYEVVYFVNSPDYNTYMDIQEEINLNLKSSLEKEKIEMAFPTQTLHIKNE